MPRESNWKKSSNGIFKRIWCLWKDVIRCFIWVLDFDVWVLAYEQIPRGTPPGSMTGHHFNGTDQSELSFSDPMLLENICARWCFCICIIRKDNPKLPMKCVAPATVHQRKSMQLSSAEIGGGVSVSNTLYEDKAKLTYSCTNLIWPDIISN